MTDVEGDDIIVQILKGGDTMLERLKRAFRAGEQTQPWSGELVLEAAGPGRRAGYRLASYSTVALRWVSRGRGDDGEPLRLREPRESTVSYTLAEGFTAAGRRYGSLEELYTEHDKTKTFCRDRYGREVLYLAERFPCFDSCDYDCENRFYRWFFLRENDRLTRVYYEDETEKVHVTEDVQYLEEPRWREMLRLGYFEKRW